MFFFITYRIINFGGTEFCLDYKMKYLTIKLTFRHEAQRNCRPVHRLVRHSPSFIRLMERSANVEGLHCVSYPLLFPEIADHTDENGEHDAQDQEIAKWPFEFRHVLEVHAIHAGDKG